MPEKILKTRILLRNDETANWLNNQDTVLKKGEAGVEFLANGKTKIKIGDGVKKWSELPYVDGEDIVKTQVFQIEAQAEQDDPTAIATAVGDAVLQSGDIVIIKRVIASEKYQYTAYVYNGISWCAMDGNYNAENVYFDKDLVTTSAVGNITLTNGQATIAAAGKNLKQVFDTIFVKEKNPTITQPSVGVTLGNSGAKEVGTKIIPSYTTSFNAGKYEFGPTTGCNPTSWSVTDSDGSAPLTTATGKFAEITVADDTNYTVNATVNYSEGAIPVTNVGNEYASGKIVAGSKSATSSAITGYRNSFYGTLTEKGELTSDIIRSLGKSNKALTNGSAFDITIPVGAMRVVFAYPATLRDVTSVKDVNGLNAEISGAFRKSTLSVEGLNNFQGINYKVYVTDFAEAVATANTYKVTI